jgi:two-component system, sensor histidine kinase and response regulator
MPPSETLFLGSYSYSLVALSVVIAALASYAALDLAGRVTAAAGMPRFAWLAGGATAMGVGIWSMHYVGMLAFRLPVPVLYDVPTVLVSLLAAIFASAVALLAVSRRNAGWIQFLAASPVMGGGYAPSCNVPLFDPTRRVVGPFSNRDFVCSVMANLPVSRRYQRF